VFLLQTIQMPTQEEIRQRYLERQPKDYLGFEVSEYIDYLGFEWIKENIGFKDGVEFTQAEVAAFNNPVEREALLDKMKDYMSFAFEKANNKRGISANRSICHYLAWIWLAGDREFAKEIENEYKTNYCYYGKLILRKICDFYGWDYMEWDDGELTNG
jgi:hypothetical protein